MVSSSGYATQIFFPYNYSDSEIDVAGDFNVYNEIWLRNSGGRYAEHIWTQLINEPSLIPGINALQQNMQYFAFT